MRIIAGEFRGRRLLPPEGSDTRPITDRVKQSLFDILTPLLPEARVYDCFAGTGSLGLESLSRGASHATFFELDRSAGARLRQNIATLKVEMRCRVVATDLFRWMDANAPEQRVDIIFLDPPYRYLRERPDELRRLAARLAVAHAGPRSLLVFRHDVGDELDLLTWARDDQREYGGMALEFLHPQQPPRSP